MKRKTNPQSSSSKELPTIEEGIPEEKPVHYKSIANLDIYDSLIKSKGTLDKLHSNNYNQKSLIHSKTTDVVKNPVNVEDINPQKKRSSPTKPPLNKFNSMETKGKYFQSLNYKNEKFIEESMQQIKKKLDDNLKDFEKKLNHEILIISFLEDCFPILDSIKSNQKSEFFSVFGFILSKYLCARITYIKFCMEKQENFLEIDDWNLVKINALLDKRSETFLKKQMKLEENMKMFLEETKDFKPKEAKFKDFLKNDIDFIEDSDRIYKKSFLHVFMGISEILEKGKKHGASKYHYAFILRMYQFLTIYIELGFFKMDVNDKIEVKKFQEDLLKLDIEGLKNAVIMIFKNLY